MINGASAWSRAIRRAQAATQNDPKGAFIMAYGALEQCYRAKARENGWRPLGRQGGMRDLIEWLRERRLISDAHFEIADHLRMARNTVTHADGFEPSVGQTVRSIDDVKRLCGAFSQTVADVMAQPVIAAEVEQPIGDFVEHMIQGISNFPVFRGDKMVGTLRDVRVLQALSDGGGIVDPEMRVTDLMEGKLLDEIEPEASLDEALRRLTQTMELALLVRSGAGRLVQARRAMAPLLGIVTPWDVMRRIDL